MAVYVAQTTREYLDEEEGAKHLTAAKLGAKRTGFLVNAAGTVKAVGTDTGVTMTMQRAGLSRAFFKYVLTPKYGTKLLTIPLKKESYGRRARAFEGLKWRTFSKEDVAQGKSDRSGLVLGRPAARGSKKKGVKKGMFIALFAGAKKVTIEKDRKILPTDQDWIDAAEYGLNKYLEASRSK